MLTSKALYDRNVKGCNASNLIGLFLFAIFHWIQRMRVFDACYYFWMFGLKIQYRPIFEEHCCLWDYIGCWIDPDIWYGRSQPKCTYLFYEYCDLRSCVGLLDPTLREGIEWRNLTPFSNSIIIRIYKWKYDNIPAFETRKTGSVTKSFIFCSIHSKFMFSFRCHIRSKFHESNARFGIGDGEAE